MNQVRISPDTGMRYVLRKEARRLLEVAIMCAHIVPRWYVLTGSPSSGVTTTVRCLEKSGYYVVEEPARSIIEEEIAKGRTAGEIRKNERAFQRRVFKRELEILKNVPKDRIVFFDKGIPDCLAYFEIHGMKLEEVLEHCKRKLYKKIFFLERLRYEKDYARVESEEMARRIGEISKKWYVSLGYEVVLIQRASVEERRDIILSHVI